MISSTIINYKKNFAIPFAFETSTNYLKKQLFELEYGNFVSQIAERSDSHILLDIHNIWANQLNGRQTVAEFISSIPTERVIEVHLAGGFWYKNYYLDSHSGTTSDELLELSSKIIKQLPNLKAVTFEILPDYLQFKELKQLRKNIEAIKRLWDMRGKDFQLPKNKSHRIKTVSKIELLPTPIVWENTLGALSLRMNPIEPKFIDLFEGQKGLIIIQELVDRFRASALLSTLKFTCRYIINVYGSDYLYSIFKSFWKEYSPKLFPVETGIEFANYLLLNADSKIFDLSYIKQIITYEYQSLLSVYNETDVEYLTDINPVDIVGCLLNEDMRFTSIKKGYFQIKIEKKNHLNELNKMNITFHS